MHVMNRPLRGELAPRKTPLRGIQVFVSGSRNTWYAPVRDGDILYSFGGTESFTEKERRFPAGLCQGSAKRPHQPAR